MSGNLIPWLGNKARLMKELLPRLPDPSQLRRSSRYFEPFAGGLALFWIYGSKFKHSTLSDTNEDLIDFYICVRDDPRRVIQACRALKRRETLSNHEALFYTYRDRLNSLREKFQTRRLNYRERIEKAALFFYILRHGFNAIYRINTSGRVNTPYRRKRLATFPIPEHIFEMSSKLQHADLRVCSYDEALRKARHGDFAFLDPPYFQCHNSFYIRYSKETFGEAEQKRLRDECDRLTRKGVLFAQTNSNCPGIHKLYSAYQVTPLTRAHGIERRKGTMAAKEVLITNYDENA